MKIIKRHISIKNLTVIIVLLAIITYSNKVISNDSIKVNDIKEDTISSKVNNTLTNNSIDKRKRRKDSLRAYYQARWFKNYKAAKARRKDSIRRIPIIRDSLLRVQKAQARQDSVNKVLVNINRPKPALMDRILIYIANKFYPKKLSAIINRAEDRKSNDDNLILTLFFFIHFFIINFIFISIISLGILMLKIIKEKKIKSLSLKYQNLLVEYIFMEADTQIPPELKFMENDKFNRSVLIDEIIKFNKNLYGEAREKLRYLYLDIQLDKDSINNINNRRWYIQAKGFRQLAQMNITDANKLIDDKLNSSNDILSFEAQLALVQLNHDSPFEFLDKLKKYFPLWNQLNIQILIKSNNIKVPDFSKWLNSENIFVTTFALRMIKIFQQQNSFNLIVPLLKHPDETVRKNAIITIGNLGMNEALIYLREIFVEQEASIKILILKAMQSLPDESNIKFLGDLLQDPNNDIKFQAGKAILSLGEIGKSKLLLAKMSANIENIDIVTIVDHLLDKKIS